MIVVSQKGFLHGVVRTFRITAHRVKQSPQFTGMCTVVLFNDLIPIGFRIAAFSRTRVRHAETLPTQFEFISLQFAGILCPAVGKDEPKHGI